MGKAKKALALLTAFVMALMLVPSVSLAAPFSDELQAALDALEIHNANDIRGSITLPSEGENGVEISWRSSNENIISTHEIENEGYIPTPAGHVTRGENDALVTLTATLTLDGEFATKTFDVTVKGVPASAGAMDADGDKYLMYYFKADGEANERIWLAGSDDGLNWVTLNNDRPIITSTLGTHGLRDPYIISNPTGDKFYLIATDLNTTDMGWGTNSVQGSKSVMIWESNDLINWSDQRMVRVSTDDMGCTWAPEVTYDATRELYVMYWAAKVNGKYSVYEAETSDFVTFSDPKPFVEKDPYTGNPDNVIDTTIIYVEGEGYYRFTKNETLTRVFMEHSTELLGNYEPVKYNVYDAEAGVEGPEIFRLKDGRYCLILDRYTQGGYFPYVTESLKPAEGSDSVEFTKLTEGYSFPHKPRHGGIVRISGAAYDAVVKSYETPAAAVEPDEAGSGPIISYRFDEEDVTVATDSDGDGKTVTVKNLSGDGFDGRISGSYEIVMDEERDSSVLSLDGRDASGQGTKYTYVEIPKGALDGRNELTVSMDVKNKTQGNYFTFAIGQNEEKYLFTRIWNSSVYAAITNSSNGGEQGATAGGTNMDDKWQNVTFTISDKDDTLKLYIDGVLVGLNESVTTTVSDLMNDAMVFIGKSLWPGDGYGKMKLDNVEIYNRVLTDEEIEAKYSTPAEDNRYSITVDADKLGPEINDGTIGLFFEDINYAGDGGLYSEAVNNRSFEAYDAAANQTDPTPIPGYGWSPVGGAELDYTSGGAPLNGNNTTYLTLTAAAEGEGAENNCYAGDGVGNRPLGKGLNAVKGAKYRASFYVRGDYAGAVKMQVVNGDAVLGELEADKVTAEFTKISGTIQIDESCDDARVRIVLSEPGTVDLDMVSLIPLETFNGRDNGLRADLVERLAEIHPGFLRFPGGCIIEGYNLDNRYQWKHTVGPVEQRTQNWNRWQTHNEFHTGNGMYGYCQTYGLGFYEYLLLCEDIGAAAVPVVNVGIACQYQSGEVSSKDDLNSIYIQDALDLIEFANGDPDPDWAAIDYANVDTTDSSTFNGNWANLRALMGHPASFELGYIGIGNEQWDTSDYSAGKVDADGWANNGNNFFRRYELFEEAIHAENPDIKLISTSGPSPDGSDFDKAWRWLKGHSDSGDGDFTYAVDEHYYKDPPWFYDNINRYDSYDRNGYGVFAGEYASRHWENMKYGRGNTVEAAISEAAYMTALEKNSDVVKMASYAPLFAREGATQWTPDMIWFDNATSYGSADYYVQQLFSRNSGDVNLKNKVVDKYDESDLSGIVGVGTWLTSAKFTDLTVTNDDTGEAIPVNGWNNSSEGDFGYTGTWNVGEGAADQSDIKFGYDPDNGKWGDSAYLFADMEPITAENYTITLKATKTGGDEGFLIPVMAKDSKNLIHWNIGGWGNKMSAFEIRTNGSNTRISAYAYPFTADGNVLKDNREYNIKIVVKGGTIFGYIDDVLVNSCTFSTTQGPIYGNATYDNETKDIIVKIVNSSDHDQNVPVTVNYSGALTGRATRYLIDGGSKPYKNTFADPERISIVRDEIDADNEFTYRAPANSATAIRIHTDGVKAVNKIETTEVYAAAGRALALPDKVNVTLDGGASEARNVEWRFPEAGTFINEGKFKVYGTVEGTELDAVAHVVLSADATEGAITVDGEKLLSGEKTTVTFYPALNEDYKADEFYKGIVAIYDADGMLVRVETLDSKAGLFSLDLTLTEAEAAGCTVKLMIWTSDGLAPVSYAELKKSSE